MFVFWRELVLWQDHKDFFDLHRCTGVQKLLGGHECKANFNVSNCPMFSTWPLFLNGLLKALLQMCIQCNLYCGTVWDLRLYVDDVTGGNSISVARLVHQTEHFVASVPFAQVPRGWPGNILPGSRAFELQRPCLVHVCNIFCHIWKPPSLYSYETGLSKMVINPMKQRVISIASWTKLDMAQHAHSARQWNVCHFGFCETVRTCKNMLEQNTTSTCCGTGRGESSWPQSGIALASRTAGVNAVWRRPNKMQSMQTSTRLHSAPWRNQAKTYKYR